MDRIGKLKEMLSITPADSFLQHALALEYIKLGNDTAAKQVFAGLLEKDPAYVGSYYHLAKLLERNNEREEAISVYEKGMQQAKLAGDNHAYNELRAAYEEI